MNERELSYMTMAPNVNFKAKTVISKEYCKYADEGGHIEDVLNNPRYERLSTYIHICEKSREPYLWVFGYGSLIWKPNFDYALCAIGYVEKQARRFWQGNCTHRGTLESVSKPAPRIRSVGNTGDCND